jgi:hypothetical protein
MVHLLIGKYLNEVTFTTVLLCVVSLYEGVTSAVVPGERYRGPVVRVLEIIGQQQCVRECRHRPKLCRGVNYRKQELLCELVSAIDKTETNPDYVRIELNQVLFYLFCFRLVNNTYEMFIIRSINDIFLRSYIFNIACFIICPEELEFVRKTGSLYLRGNNKAFL